ncbi:hypothetical protein [Rhodococcus sp. NPDC049939]|uniref:hypothetical protein n=1 Tax=Rhodococcus sp. NPDC049939 TaxID=3155511 RepID=UPI0033CA7F04
MIEVDQTGISPNHSSRHGARIRLYVLHTQEGRGDAYSLARYLQQSRSRVSYHYSCDNFTNVDVVDTDRASWSVLDANPYTVNFCFAGSFARMGRDEWLTKFGNAIQEAARIFVQDGRKYAFDNLYTVDWNQISRGMSGATDHYGITMGLGIGTHTDVGPHFPWDVFAAWIAQYRDDSDPVNVPVPNAIAAKRAVSEWLGDKITEAIELSTPDGRGRYVEYEHGYIYWTPEYGAHAIPLELFDAYAKLGWETGPLGYPVGDHTVLTEGLVQAFERGTLYRKAGQPGFYVTGLIGERWRRAGFENGPLGWPTSNEIPFDSGAYQQFENGRIYWAPDETIAVLSVDGDDVPLSERVQKYIPTAQERRLTPVHGMQGGISYFGGPDDRSTRGRKMGISGESADYPTDPWYCAMRFNYCRVQPDPANGSWVKPVAGTSDLELKAYLPHRRLQVTNPANGRSVVVRPADWGPGAWAVPGGPKFRVVDVSQQAMRSIGAVTDTYVEIEWIDPATPLGPREGN